MIEQGLGRHDGAHRARRGLRRRRRPHEGRAAARRLLAHQRREAVHHLRRARPQRQHHPPGAGPPRGREGRHQGAVAVRRPQVPRRPRDRRAGRAQRRLRHQRREEDGPQGLHDLRGHLRRRPGAGPGLAGRRGARRHRADVQDHRVRPDVRRHQGDRHAVGRLPGGAGLREEPRAGRRPDRDVEGRPAGDHHPPPRRPPLADAAEVLRRGHARAVPVRRELPRPGHPGHGRGPRRQRGGEARRAGQRPAAADREGLRLRAGDPAAHRRVAADPGRLGLPAGLPDRAVHPRLQDRHPLRGHDGDPGSGLLLPEDRQGRRRRADLARLADPGDDRRRGGQRPAQGGAGAAGRGAAATSRACSPRCSVI